MLGADDKFDRNFDFSVVLERIENVDILIPKYKENADWNLSLNIIIEEQKHRFQYFKKLRCIFLKEVFFYYFLLTQHCNFPTLIFLTVMLT